MPPVGFEPTISAGERPQTYTLGRAATGTGQGLTHISLLSLLSPNSYALISIRKISLGTDLSHSSYNKLCARQSLVWVTTREIVARTPESEFAYPILHLMSRSLTFQDWSVTQSTEGFDPCDTVSSTKIVVRSPLLTVNEFVYN